jgi:hypothetical protein
MPYAALVCEYCGEHLGKVDEDSTRREHVHRKDCSKYKAHLKKQNQRSVQPLPKGKVIGQAGIPSLGKKKP